MSQCNESLYVQKRSSSDNGGWRQTGNEAAEGTDASISMAASTFRHDIGTTDCNKLPLNKISLCVCVCVCVYVYYISYILKLWYYRSLEGYDT
jgi:hypothetical protein